MENKGNVSITIVACIGILFLLLVSAGLYRFTKHFSGAKHPAATLITRPKETKPATTAASFSTTLDQEEESIQKDLDGMDSTLNAVDTSLASQSADTIR